jgi:hypothetical protein
MKRYRFVRTRWAEMDRWLVGTLSSSPSELTFLLRLGVGWIGRFLIAGWLPDRRPSLCPAPPSGRPVWVTGCHILGRPFNV